MRISHAFSKLVLTLIATATCGIATAQPTGGVYQVTNLISDGSVAATITDAKFLNPWAISVSGTWWISTEASGYNYIVSSTTTPVPPATYSKVTVPAATGGTTATGTPTGSVTTGGSPTTALILSNGTKASFLFSTLDGTISGWNGPIGQAGTALIAINNSASGASYNGLALLNTATATYILAPNFASGKIEIYDGTFAKTTLPGNFTDPNLPSGYAPYSIHILNSKIYVAYAVQANPIQRVPVGGNGNGIVSVFDLSGNFVARAITGGNLNIPWGVAIAPASFGIYGGALLVGNFGNGLINAYDANSYAYLGQLSDATGKPLVYPTLWELLPAGTLPSNSTTGSGGVANSVYFTAGLANQAHGLFGAISNNTTATTPATFGITSSNASLNVARGNIAQTTVSIAPINKFSGTVNFSCSGLPQYASCTFVPSSVNATANAPITTTMNISTSNFTAKATPPHVRRTQVASLAVAFVLPFGSVLAFYRRRCLHNPLRLFTLIGIALLSLGAITSCSSSSNALISSPAGTSTVTVTGTSGATTQTTTFSLVVQ
jgi:uncharacterized protein (TIGR03118 family)